MDIGTMITAGAVVVSIAAAYWRLNTTMTKVDVTIATVGDVLEGHAGRTEVAIAELTKVMREVKESGSVEHANILGISKGIQAQLTENRRESTQLVEMLASINARIRNGGLK